MGRTSRKDKKKPLKSKMIHPKGSKFSVHNNDMVLKGLTPPNGNGSPTSYLYGSQAQDKKRRKKAKGKGPSAAKRKSFSARNKKSKRLFIARFPVIGAKSPSVPWLKGTQGKASKTEKAASNQRKRKLVNGALSVDASSLELLKFELEQFWSYVTLSEKEVRIREYLIGKVSESCNRLFGVEDSQCQVFGSFAARSVCIFDSDVDLAIWGVVEPDEDEEDSVDNQIQNDENKDQSQKEANTKKQDRVLKWKELIDNATSNRKADENPGGASLTESSSADSVQSEQSALFVLDRNGDVNDDSHLERISGEIGESSCDSESDSADDDTADKLENFQKRTREPRDLIETSTRERSVVFDSAIKYDHESQHVEEAVADVISMRRPRGQSLVSLSSSTTCSVEAKLDESGLEVSYVVDATTESETKPKSGPCGRTRTRVVNSLYKLTRPLRAFASNMHVRKKARVPIINMVTHFGFECDIALGGHNGTDTSSYATTQLSRFKSFASIVVLLKVLLIQQGLDKPFTGGLGSYSLYVLVANHIERHLELGGEDDPAEVLYTFLFRYGCVQHSNSKIPSSYRTRLSQKSVIQTKDGSAADMKSCFQIENCITVFEACWRMLHKRLSGKPNKNFSILQYMIDSMKLEMGRSKSKKQADANLSKGPVSSHFGFVRDEKKESLSDEEARQLIASYGQKVEGFLPVKEGGAKKKTFQNKKKKKRQRTS